MNEQTKAFVSAAVVIIVQLAAIFGYQLDAAAVTSVVSACVIIGVTVLSMWKNFNFTYAAARGQAVTNSVKTQLKDAENGVIATKPDGLDDDTTPVDEAEELTVADEDGDD